MFLLILNDQVEWYYPVVAIIVFSMYYIASSFYVLWFIKDTIDSRARLPWAIILILIATSLVAVWHIIYFSVLYKRETVYIGWGDDNEYKKFNKGYYLFVNMLDAIIVLVCYSYFLCVVYYYRDAMRQAKEKKKIA